MLKWYQKKWQSASILHHFLTFYTKANFIVIINLSYRAWTLKAIPTNQVGDHTFLVYLTYNPGVYNGKEYF